MFAAKEKIHRCLKLLLFSMFTLCLLPKMGLQAQAVSEETPVEPTVEQSVEPAAEPTPAPLFPRTETFPIPPQTGIPPRREDPDFPMPAGQELGPEPSIEELMPATNDEGQFLIDDIPSDLTSGAVEFQPPSGPVDNLPRRIEFRKTRTRALTDPAVIQAANEMTIARETGTFQEIRASSRNYYSILYRRMRKISPKLADMIQEAEVRDMERTVEFPTEFEAVPTPDTIRVLLETNSKPVE